MTPFNPWLVLAATVIAVVRVIGEKSPAFQAVAHLFVGGLFGAWFLCRNDRQYLFLAVLLSGLELLCFLSTRAVR